MLRPSERATPLPPGASRRAAQALAALALVALGPACTAQVSYGRAPAAAPAAPPPPMAPPLPAAAPVAAPAPAAAPEPWTASDAPQADPEARRLFLVRASQPALGLAQAAAPPRVTALALAHTARGEAQGMRAEESISGATLREGERAAAAVVIAPGECATFVAQGGLGVVEVDLFLVSRRGAPAPEILAEDPTSGPIAVIGGRGACFPNRGAAPLKAELHAQVRRGAGVVLVQGYRAPAPALRPPQVPGR
ncbi:MAG: hypothetical protein IT372_04090 [Polyangiaceae bacterium]|nr:hypothetical protein [Polyangiaceae bacterium]